MADDSTNQVFPTSTGPLVSLGDRVRRVAAEGGVSLDYRDGVWVATDTATGERASGLSMAGAWAGLRDVDAYTVHGWLDEADAALVRPPEDRCGA
jgi:hypothetical protein